MALPHVQQALAPHVPMYRHANPPDSSTRGHSNDSAPRHAAEQSRAESNYHLSNQLAQHDTHETRRSGTPWWMWFVLGAHELLGKVPGYPSGTINAWLQEQSTRSRTTDAREAVIFQELQRSSSLHDAYRSIKGMGYTAPKDALRHLFRYLVRVRPLEHGTTWSVNAPFLEALVRDGMSLDAFEHESKVFQVEETATRLLTPDEVVRQCEHMRQAIGEFRHIMHAAVEQSFAETQDRTHFLYRELNKNTEHLIARVLGQWHDAHTRSSGTTRVHLDGFTVDLSLGYLQHLTPSMPDSLRSVPEALHTISQALLRGETLSPIQEGIVNQLLTESPSFREYLDHHTGDLHNSVEDRQRARDLLRSAGHPKNEALRTALFMASQQPGASIALERPGHERISITWGTPQTGLGVHLSASEVSHDVRSPFHLRSGSLLKINAQQQLAAEPALVITGRSGATQYITKSDILHLETLVQAAQTKTTHAGELLHVITRTANDIRAAWLSVFSEPPSQQRYPAQVYERAEIIARTNWGFALLQQIDALTRKLSAYHQSIHTASPGEARQYLRTMVEIHLGSIVQQYQQRFSSERGQQFAQQMQQLGEHLVMDRSQITRTQEALVRVTMAELRHTAQHAAPGLWPPLRSSQLSREFATLHSLTPDMIAQGNIPEDIQQKIGRLGGTRQRSQQRPSLQRARQYFSSGSTEQALTELFRIMHRFDMKPRTRMNAAAMLARISARQGQWGHVDFALQEMAQLSLIGQSITPEATKLLTDIAKDRRVPAVRGVIPVRIPIELLPELSPALAALPERAHEFLSRIERGAIAEVSLPVLPGALEAVADPWARWQRLPPGLQVSLVEAMQTDLLTGVRAPLEVLKIIAVLDAREFPRWMEILYGSNAEHYLREVLRLEPYRAKYFRLIKTQLEQNHIDPRTIIADTTARDRAARKSITGDLVRPNLPAAPASQLWEPPPSKQRTFLAELPAKLRSVRTLSGEIGGPALVSSLVFINSKHMMHALVPIPSSSTGQAIFGINILGLAHITDTGLQQLGQRWVHRNHPRTPRSTPMPLQARRLFGSMGLGFAQWRFFAGTSQLMGASPEHAEYIGLGATGLVHGATQATMKRLTPKAFDILHNPTTRRLAQVPHSVWVAGTRDQITLSLSRSAQRGGAAYLAFDMLFTLGGALYEDYAMEPTMRYVRNMRNVRRKAYIKQQSFFGNSDGSLIKRGAYSLLALGDQIIPDQLHMLSDDIVNRAEQRTDTQTLEAKWKNEHYQHRIYPAAVQMMRACSDITVHALLKQLDHERQQAHPAPLRSVLQHLFTHNAPGKVREAWRQWEAATAQALQAKDLHWIFRHQAVDQGALDARQSDALLYWLHKPVLHSIDAVMANLETRLLAQGLTTDRQQLEALSLYRSALTHAVNRFEAQHQPGAQHSAPWAYPLHEASAHSER